MGAYNCLLFLSLLSANGDLEVYICNLLSSPEAGKQNTVIDPRLKRIGKVCVSYKC